MNESGHIFISYKTEERELALKVRDHIQAWGYETWLDVDRLQAGTYWANHIDHALKHCRACVAVVTPHSLASRYVTNEWDLAIMQGKPLLPLMFEHTDPHYKYIDIQYIDFTSGPPDDGYARLRSRLEGLTAAQAPPRADPHADYLQSLFDRINAYLSAKLIKSLRDEQGLPDPIQLGVETTNDAVDVLFHRREQVDPLFLAGGLAEETTAEFDDFTRAFEFFDGRVLLLGEPGAGKTVTLLHFARDAIVRRRNTPDAPLPILALIPTWDAVTPVEQWIASVYGAPDNASEIMRRGHALLLLDGLDELGSEKEVRKGERIVESFDPRERFMQQLPASNQLLLASRTREYQDVGRKIALNGAITLRSLNTDQIAHYLAAQPELLAFVESEDSLREWLDTPLLLSFFALAYESMSPGERAQLTGMLDDAGEFRATIFDNYVRERYRHEENKYRLRGEQMPMSLNELLSIMSRIALRNMVSFDRYDTTSHGAHLQPMIRQQHNAIRPDDRIHNEWGFHAETFDKAGDWRVNTMIHFTEMPAVELACQLNLVLADDDRYQFIHLLLRNHFAYLRCVEVLAREVDEKASSMLQGFDVVAAAIALRDIKDPRAIPLLRPHLEDRRWFSFGYRESASPSVEVERTLRVLESTGEQ